MADQDLPLAGIRVVDCSQVAAGPYLASLLGDLGADVIKVEPTGGDSLRGIDDAFGEGRSSYFFGVNRSKRDIALDLGNPAARPVLDRLVDGADVLILGMRPAAVARAGLDDARLRARNPGLVHVSITGYGESGPRADDPGMDILAQALSGIMGLTGEPDRAPVRVAPPLTDVTTSFVGAYAICAALFARATSGVGRRIELNLLDSAIATLPNYATQYLRMRQPIRPEGGGHPQIVPYQVFGTRDGWMIVACISDRFWPSLCAAIERPDLVDQPDYRSNVERVRHRETLVPLLEELFRTGTTAEWIDRLRAFDVPCSEIHRLEGVFEDPQVVHNEIVVDVVHPDVGPYRTIGSPVRIDGRRPQPTRPAPELGEHTAEILRELGYDAAAIDDLVEAGAVRAGSERTAP